MQQVSRDVTLEISDDCTRYLLLRSTTPCTTTPPQPLYVNRSKTTGTRRKTSRWNSLLRSSVQINRPFLLAMQHSRLVHGTPLQVKVGVETIGPKPVSQVMPGLSQVSALTKSKPPNWNKSAATTTKPSLALILLWSSLLDGFCRRWGGREFGTVASQCACNLQQARGLVSSRHRSQAPYHIQTHRRRHSRNPCTYYCVPRLSCWQVRKSTLHYETHSTSK